MSSDFYSQGVLYRACSRCHKAYPLDADHFRRTNSTRSGFRGECKACARAMDRASYLSRRSLPPKPSHTSSTPKATARARELHAKLEASAVARQQMLQIIKEATGARLAREMPDLGLRVAAFCDRTGMTYAEFARNVGADWQTVYEWTRGGQAVGPKHAVDVLLYVGDRPQRGATSRAARRGPAAQANVAGTSARFCRPLPTTLCPTWPSSW